MPKCKICGKFRRREDFNNKTQTCSICMPTKVTHMKYGKFIQDLKRSQGCFFCDERDSVALDYHHVHPISKKFGLGNVQGQDANEIFEEINKCVVLCSNCHRKLHAGRLNLSKAKLKQYDSYSPHGNGS